jgi:methyltransferase (TIGR00027 family)
VQTGQPSQTARGAAAYRAIHQRLDSGVIFSDPFAARILDDETRARLDETAADPSLRPWRLFIAARSRFSEDTLAGCVARGVRQVVVLGAGLDTFSLRNPYAGQGVRVFEVDYPATQGWKCERLKQAGLAIPASLTFAPVDFERQSLADGLKAAGFQADRPAFFQWLGVVPYLTREAVSLALDFIAGVPESEVVFDYAEPFENYPADRRVHVMEVAAAAAGAGRALAQSVRPGRALEHAARQRLPGCRGSRHGRDRRSLLRRVETRHRDRSRRAHCSGTKDSLVGYFLRFRRIGPAAQAQV